MENDQGAPGMCDDCKGAGGWASNELCETCNGTGRQTALVQRVPDGYAYRYPDGYIRHNDGREVNGSKPTEVLPWFYSTTVADVVAELTTKLTAERAGRQPAQPESGETVRASLEEEAAMEAALRFSDSEYQMAFREGYVRAMTIAGRRLTAAQQRIAALHASLRTYGWHKPECDYMQEELPCTCGFMDAIKEPT